MWDFDPFSPRDSVPRPWGLSQLDAEVAFLAIVAVHEYG